MRSPLSIIPLLPLLFIALSSTHALAVDGNSLCKYDWTKIETLWNEYLFDANAKTGEALIHGLYTSRESKENPACDERIRVQKLLVSQASEKLIKFMKMPATRVPEILQALLAHSDGQLTEELHVTLGKSAALDPLGFVTLIKVKYKAKSCPFIGNDPEQFNDTDTPAIALNKTKMAFDTRMKQMKRVLPKDLAKAKGLCIKALEKAIKKTDAQIAELKKK